MTKQDNEKATVTKHAYNIGDVLPDGWIVGPVSPDTGIVMAIEPVDSALDDPQTWYAGEAHAKELLAQGNANARQATISELSVIYNEIVKAGNNDNAKFNAVASDSNCRYWASTPYPGHSDRAQLQYFSNGDQHWHCKKFEVAYIRCVRDEPGLTLA